MVAAILLLDDLRVQPSERVTIVRAGRARVVEGIHGGEPTKPSMIQKTFLDHKVLLSEDVPNVMEWGGEEASRWPIAGKRP
jgi:hypothetical protein